VWRWPAGVISFAEYIKMMSSGGSFGVVSLDLHACGFCFFYSLRSEKGKGKNKMVSNQKKAWQGLQGGTE